MDSREKMLIDHNAQLQSALSERDKLIDEAVTNIKEVVRILDIYHQQGHIIGRPIKAEMKRFLARAEAMRGGKG